MVVQVVCIRLRASGSCTVAVHIESRPRPLQSNERQDVSTTIV
jgi:hypothetical protein